MPSAVDISVEGDGTAASVEAIADALWFGWAA